jgi:uncharacterized protein
VSFSSGPYRLRGELLYPETARPTGVVLLVGPHPLLGGTMHNNVIQRLGDGLARRGLVALRFDYRGVGLSEGPPIDLDRHLRAFWENSRLPEERELGDDLVGARAFLTSVVDEALPRALVGYSFGCSLLPEVVDPEAETPLVLIAPTVGQHDLSAFVGLPQPKLVIAPEGDFAARPEAVRAWFGQLPGPRQLVQPNWDGHFFRRHEEELTEQVFHFLEEAWR